MDVSVRGPGPVEPFLGARDLFETERDLARPVTVQVVADSAERTRVSHDADGHRLTISRQAATSAMARELALHEYAHMHRHECEHPSHTQSTREAIYLALAGRSVEQRKLTHCYQIANHMKDIYADDIWLAVAPADKLVSFLEASLAAALADRPRDPPVWDRLALPGGEGAGAGSTHQTGGTDPEIAAVNAAFALGLVERHELVDQSHRLYDLADAAAADAPTVAFDSFRRQFRSLADNPDESEYRKALVDAARTYAGERGPAAD
jgi:hypothetical protein